MRTLRCLTIAVAMMLAAVTTVGAPPSEEGFDAEAFAGSAHAVSPLRGRPIGLDPAARAEGWSRYPHRAERRVIYVSNSEGSNGYDGRSPDTPVQTIARGRHMLRDGHGDWLMLKRGDTFPSGLGEWFKSGASEQNPMIVGAYGRGPRPRLQPHGQPVLTVAKGAPRHLAFISLHAHAATRDPDSPHFNGGHNKVNGVFWTAGGGDVRFEDCLFEYFNNNMAFISPSRRNPIENITLYRCTLRYSYATPKQGFAKQGFFGRNLHNVRLRECVFYHNGWSERVKHAGRTMFGHNVYLAGTKDLRIEGCLVADGALNGLNLRTGNQPEQIQRNVVVRNNLLVGNTNGIVAAAVEGRTMRSSNLRVIDNVLVRHGGRIPMGNKRLEIANGITLSNWDGAVVRGNLLLRSPQGAGSAAIKVQTWKRTESRSVKITDNIVHQWGENRVKPKGSDVTVGQNHIGLGPARFVDAGRSLPRYSQAQAGVGSIDAFLERAGQMRKGHWPGRLTAGAINAFLREGFTAKPASARPADDAAARDPSQH
jgi:hypothetical protein